MLSNNKEKKMTKNKTVTSTITDDTVAYLSYTDCKAEYDKIRKEVKDSGDPKWQESEYRHEAARRLGVDYYTFMSAWKSKGTVPYITTYDIVIRLPKSHVSEEQATAIYYTAMHTALIATDDACTWANFRPVPVVSNDTTIKDVRYDFPVPYTIK